MTVGTSAARLAMPIDAIGRVSSRTVTAAGHAYATAYGYAAGNNGSGNTTPLISSLTQSGENFTYTYDNVGNIASVVQNNKTTAYTYDALGQLIRVNDQNDTTSGTAGTTWTYEYDRGGNILAKKRYAYTTGTLGTALETVTYTYDTTWKDKLINYNGITIEYDAIGNPTKAGTKTGEVWDPDTWHYTWARGRQLQVMYKGSFGQPGYDEIAFTYNHEGLRTRKTRMYYSDGDVAYSSTEYTLHGKNIVHMTQGNDSLHFFYDASNRPAIVEWNNGVTAAKYAYIQNLQGDIVGIVDSNGTEVVKYAYDAWGRVLSGTGSLAATLGTIQPFRYRGYVYDIEIGIYYLRSRYYNPTWQRFLNADKLICENLYCYCKLNPIQRSDKSGYYSSVYMETMYNYLSERNAESEINNYALATVNVNNVFIRKNPTMDSVTNGQVDKFECEIYVKKSPIYEYAEDDIPEASFAIDAERIWFSAIIFKDDKQIEGFIRADCLYPIYGMDIQPVRVDELFLRGDPSTNNNYIDRLYYNDMVTIMFETKDENNIEWYYVLSEKGPGWIMSEFIGFGG